MTAAVSCDPATGGLSPETLAMLKASGLFGPPSLKPLSESMVRVIAEEELAKAGLSVDARR